MFDAVVMHPQHLRDRARELFRDGHRVADIARELELHYRTVYDWCAGRMAAGEKPGTRPHRCPRCRETPEPPDDPVAYAYLLGQYLGDGHVSLRRVPVLRISCADAYPGIMDECEAAMRAVLVPTVHRVHAIGCTVVQSMSMHWPCLFPQAGPGKKHEREIALQPWQQDLADTHPGPLLRGLFHSDGCRCTNRIYKEGKAYAYPRYFFSNRSAGVMDVCRGALDRLKIEWRMARPDSLSVARKEAVAALDRWVGAKA
jgi:hypothetical protein